MDASKEVEVEIPDVETRENRPEVKPAERMIEVKPRERKAEMKPRESKPEDTEPAAEVSASIKSPKGIKSSNYYSVSNRKYLKDGRFQILHLKSSFW